MPGIACQPVLLVAVISCFITHTSLECPALDAPCPPPGDGHLQAGMIAATHTKAAFNDPPFFPCMERQGLQNGQPSLGSLSAHLL